MLPLFNLISPVVRVPKKITCPSGHTYYKSSDCPVCPQCENARKTSTGWKATLAAPARRALENNGIHTLEQLAAYSEKEILSFHGMGKSFIPKLRAALQAQGLDFKSTQ